MSELAKDKSAAKVLLSASVKQFDKRQASLLTMFSRIEGRAQPYESVMELPKIDNDNVILFAILVQNAMHPKNSQRVDAVAKEEYVDIMSREQADAFLSSLLHKHLTNELSGIE